MLETALCGNRIVPGTKEASGGEGGRHGLLLLSQSGTAEVVNKLCRLSAPEGKKRASSTAGTRCISPSIVRPSAQVSYTPLELTAGKALHADIRSIADYKAVEFLVLQQLRLRLPLTSERDGLYRGETYASRFGSADKGRRVDTSESGGPSARPGHAVQAESWELIEAVAGTGVQSE